MIKSLLTGWIPDSFKQEFKIKLGAPHMYWSISNLRKNGLDAKQIIDVGAYKGEWTHDVLKIFPGAEYLMIEANPERDKDLAAFLTAHKNPRVRYELALLASQTGENKVFHVMDTASSVLDEHKDTTADKVQLTTHTLDEIARKNGFTNVSLVKLDVQGYEVEILKGGEGVLRQAEAILMEVSLLDIHKNVPLLREVLNFMYEYQFVAYDICSVAARRPMDRALWQTDVLFVKEDSRYRSNKSYF
jgi:FkbM family methyltransferase